MEENKKKIINDFGNEWEKFNQLKLNNHELGRIFDDYFKILPVINEWSSDENRIKTGDKVSEDFVYSSELNTVWVSEDDMRDWLDQNIDSIGNI